MKLAIMQPYFFPYLGYYSLIKNSDKFILLDEMQFIRHGWINRNRVLKPATGWQYVTAPLTKYSAGTLIKDMMIHGDEEWKSKLLRQLEHYKSRAPFFKDTFSVIEKSIELKTKSIVELNANILTKTCEYLNLPLDLKIFSEMNLRIGNIEQPDDWALEISKSLRANVYLNPIGGVQLFEPEKFKANDISIRFIRNNLTTYSQRRPNFENGLSIIDVMMFNDIESINNLINDVAIVE